MEDTAAIPTGATDGTTITTRATDAIPTTVATADPAAIRTTSVTTNSLAKKPPQCVPSKTKRRSALHLLKAAWLMLRGKDKKSKSLTTSSTFARLFFAVRPLKLQHNALQGPPAPPFDQLPSGDQGVPSEARGNPEVAPVGVSDQHDQAAAFKPLRHVASSPSLSSAASSSSGGMSRYASAHNLRELDEEDEEDDCDEEGDGDAYYDGIEGDEMIDAKAEEFIAQFYQQMRLQQLNAGYGKANI